MPRRIIGHIVIIGTDSEWFSEDERIREEFPLERIFGTEVPSSNIEVPDVRWGGECRVEVDIFGRLLRNDYVDIEVTARLYEGTSEDTNDLEDRGFIHFRVPPDGRPVHRRIDLHNTELGGGDHAEIRLSFTNSLAEV